MLTVLAAAQNALQNAMLASDAPFIFALKLASIAILALYFRVFNARLTVLYSLCALALFALFPARGAIIAEALSIAVFFALYFYLLSASFFLELKKRGHEKNAANSQSKACCREMPQSGTAALRAFLRSFFLIYVFTAIILGASHLFFAPYGFKAAIAASFSTIVFYAAHSAHYFKGFKIKGFKSDKKPKISDAKPQEVPDVSDVSYVAKNCKMRAARTGFLPYLLVSAAASVFLFIAASKNYGAVQTAIKAAFFASSGYCALYASYFLISRNFTEEVKISMLKEGEIPAESVIQAGNDFFTSQDNYFSIAARILNRKKAVVCAHAPLSARDISFLCVLEKKGLIKCLKIQKRISLEPFVFAGAAIAYIWLYGF